MKRLVAASPCVGGDLQLAAVRRSQRPVGLEDGAGLVACLDGLRQLDLVGCGQQIVGADLAQVLADEVFARVVLAAAHHRVGDRLKAARLKPVCLPVASGRARG